jgi:uncharacterized protein (DUF952 family)
MDARVYRICEARDWPATQASGELPRSELDRRDGFIHLSRASQVAGTLARYFAGRDDLLLLTIACDRLAEAELRFEPPRHGSSTELFPHVYGRVPLAAIISVDRLTLDEHGCHRLPSALDADPASPS